MTPDLDHIIAEKRKLIKWGTSPRQYREKAREAFRERCRWFADKRLQEMNDV